MANWKADERYLPDSDDDPDYREDSDDSDESDIPRTMGRMRGQWVVDNQDDLEAMYKVFMECGRKVFGRTFFQVGTINNFAKLCFKYTHPGALKSEP
jgi:hypothetical protein